MIDTLNVPLANSVHALPDITSKAHSAKPNLELRDYQKEAVAALRYNKRGIVAAATGSGKTTMMAASIAEKVSYGRVLVLVHLQDLVRQTAARVRAETGLFVGEYFGDTKDDLTTSMVMVATWQSMAQVVESQMIEANHYHAINVDEAHHGTAGAYAEVIEYFAPSYLHAFTATPEGRGEADLHRIFGETIYRITLHDLIRQGYLTPFQVKVVLSISRTSDEEKLTSFHQDKKPFITKMLDKLNEENRAPRVLHFFKTNKHIDDFAGAVPEFMSYRVTSMVDRDERARNLDTFRTSDNSAPHLYSVRMLNEGIDIPCINGLVFHENVGDIRTFIQRIGRGLRVHTRASHMTHVIQFVDGDDVDGILAVAELKKELDLVTGEQSSEAGIRDDLVLMEIDPNLQERIDQILQQYDNDSALDQLMDCTCGKCGQQTRVKVRQMKVLRSGDSFVCDRCSTGGVVLAKCSRCDDTVELSFDRYHSYVLMGTFARCHLHKARKGQPIEAVCVKCKKVDVVPYGRYQVYVERGLNYRCKDHRAKSGESKFLKCTECGVVERVAASNYVARWKDGARPFLCKGHRRSYVWKKNRVKEGVQNA